MKKIMLRIGAGVVGLALIAGAVFAIKYWAEHHINTRYDVVVELTDEQRARYEQRLADAQTRIETQAGEGNDWWLGYLEGAQAAHLLGRNGEAEYYYRTFLKRFPEHRIGIANYANLFFETQRYRDAEALYKKLVDASHIEEDLRDYVEVIKVQNADGARDADLLSVLEAAVVAYGQTPFLMQELADFYERTGDCDMAVQHYEVLLNLVDEEQKMLIEQDIARVADACR